ncbi:MAG: DUF1571 domain-containing protein [Isosphaeraceae bacterium]
MRRFLRMGKVLLSRPGWIAAAVLSVLALTTAGTSLYLTAPLERVAVEVPAPPSSARTAPRPKTLAASQPEIPPWPENRLEGRPAKELLLQMLRAVDRVIRESPCCTMTFHKQERIGGKLLPEQTYFMKVRHDPFAIYMRCLKPVTGRELIYAEGHYDNQVIGHPPGIARLLVPRLKVPPNSPLIMAESRHPINEAGLANMIRKMIHYREMDLADPDSITILDRIKDADRLLWFRSTHVHPVFHPDRPLGETEVLYDPQTRFPLRFTGYDRPAPGQKEKKLGERYAYDDLVLGAKLSAQDFDPANPRYEFHRF